MEWGPGTISPEFAIETAMNKAALLASMVDLLQETLDLEGDGSGAKANPGSPLIGAGAVVASLGLVSFISDVECFLSDDHGLEVTLVSEQALSRTQSPFRTIETLANYILELLNDDNRP